MTARWLANQGDAAKSSSRTVAEVVRLLTSTTELSRVLLRKISPLLLNTAKAVLQRRACLFLLVGLMSAVAVAPFVLAQNEEGAATFPLMVPDDGFPSDETSGVVERVFDFVRTLLEGDEEIDTPEDAQMQAKEFAEQFRPLLKAEMSFLRAICLPTDEQSKTIAKVGERSLKTIAESFTAQMTKNLADLGTIHEKPVVFDPRQRIQESLAESVRQILSAEQGERYREELEKRNAFLKQALLLNVVAKIDEDLALTTEQRKQLTESLSSHTKKDWTGYAELLLSGDHPTVSLLRDEHVLQFLSETQKEVWRDIDKTDGRFLEWGDLAVQDIILVDEDEEATPDDATSEIPKSEQTGEETK